MSSALTTEPEFPEILPVIEEYLKAGGKHINFWDTNHYDFKPKKVFVDQHIHERIRQFGSPLYVMEEYKYPKETCELFKAYIKGDKEEHNQVQKIIDGILQEGATPMNRAAITLFRYADDEKNSKRPTNVIFPDSRGSELDEMKNKMPKEEVRAFEKYMALSDDRLGKISDYGRRVDGDLIASIRTQVISGFDPAERPHLDKALKKLMPILIANESKDTSAIDKKISENISKDFDPEKHIQIMLYGATHFSKSNDLNKLGDLNIAIADSTNLSHIRKNYLENPGVHNDFPEYAYYTDKHKIIKLDNDKAKAEYLGMDEKQFKAWELSIKLREKAINKLTVSSVESAPTVPPTYQQPAPKNPEQLRFS